jgi:uncharacterized protein with GYD domain
LASRSSRSTTRRAITDFVDIVDAPNPEALLAFSVWYSTQGLGRIQSMPAFEAKAFETAIKSAMG